MANTSTPAPTATIRVPVTDIRIGDHITDIHGTVTAISDYRGQVKLATTGGLAYYEPTATARIRRG